MWRAMYVLIAMGEAVMEVVRAEIGRMEEMKDKSRFMVGLMYQVNEKENYHWTSNTVWMSDYSNSETQKLKLHWIKSVRTR